MISIEQRDLAHNADIVSFLRKQGETVKQEGSEFRWPGHEGLLIRGNVWCQHGQNDRGGDAISFVETFFDMTFQEAVAGLTGEGIVSSPASTTPPEPKPFHLPPKYQNNNIVIQYLTCKRGISPAIVDMFIQRGDIYEEYCNGYHNVIFVGRDRDGVPRNAIRKGTTKVQFRKEISGSLKDYGFRYTGSAKSLLCFEAPIDLLSFLTMFPKALSCSLISCGGLSNKAVVQFLADYPDIEQIYLCLDNDAPGNNECGHMMKTIPARYRVTRLIPRLKDWNDILTDGDITNPYTIQTR